MALPIFKEKSCPYEGGVDKTFLKHQLPRSLGDFAHKHKNLPPQPYYDDFQIKIYGFGGKPEILLIVIAWVRLSNARSASPLVFKPGHVFNGYCDGPSNIPSVAPPEVLIHNLTNGELGQGWTQAADVWMVGCLVS